MDDRKMKKQLKWPGNLIKAIEAGELRFPQTKLRMNINDKDIKDTKYRMKLFIRGRINIYLE